MEKNSRPGYRSGQVPHYRTSQKVVAVVQGSTLLVVASHLIELVHYRNPSEPESTRDAVRIDLKEIQSFKHRKKVLGKLKYCKYSVNITVTITMKVNITIKCSNLALGLDLAIDCCFEEAENSYRNLALHELPYPFTTVSPPHHSLSISLPW